MPNQITVEINGETFTDWESVEVYDDMEQLGNDFTLTSNVPIPQQLNIQKGQAVIIRIDNAIVLTGYVDKINKSEDANSSQMVVTGRDRVSDFIDSRLSSKTFVPPIGFIEILKKVLTEVGYEIVSSNSLSQPLQTDLSRTKIGIIDNYSKENGPIPIFKTNEGIGFKPGESAYQLIKRLADKRGLILGTDGKGNITIDAVGVNQSVTDLSRIGNSPTNNIKDATLDDGMQDLFYSYTIASMNTGEANASLSAADKQKTDAQKAIIDPVNNNVSYSATVYDKLIRPTRKFYAVVPGLNNQQCKERAIWECNIRKAKSFIYKCKVVGFRQKAVTNPEEENPLWDINTKVFLSDDRFGLERQVLIRAVRYKQSVAEGSICELTLIDQDSYTYSLFQPIIKAGKKTRNNDLLFVNPV